MELHAHLIEVIWFILSLTAFAGTVHCIWLAVKDQAFAEVAVYYKYDGAFQRLNAAENRLMTFFVRLIVVILLMVQSTVSLFSQPADLIDFMFFPQTFINVVCGVIFSIIFTGWAAVDVRMWWLFIKRQKANGQA